MNNFYKKNLVIEKLFFIEKKLKETHPKPLSLLSTTPPMTTQPRTKASFG